MATDSVDYKAAYESLQRAANDIDVHKDNEIESLRSTLDGMKAHVVRLTGLLMEVSTDVAQHALQDPEGFAKAEADGWRFISLRTAANIRGELDAGPRAP